jgi:hypothetical protein
MLLFSDSKTALSADEGTEAIKTLYETMYILVNTTAITAGSLDIEVQWSIDGNTWVSFSTPDDLPQITGTGETWLAALPARAPFMRLFYDVTTGPVTFEVGVSGF